MVTLIGHFVFSGLLSLSSECLDLCCNMNFSEIVQNPLFLSALVIFLLLIIFRIYYLYNRIVLIDQTSHGKIYLKRSQLIRIIKQNCNEVLPNVKPSISLKTKKNQLHFLIKMQCIRDVRPICYSLQEKIYNSLINQTGITNVGSINIIIKKIILNVIDNNNEQCQISTEQAESNS